jgi:uncharacterized DUF497 family protein
MPPQRGTPADIAERGLSFELVEEFRWDSVLVIEDAHRD